MGFRSNIAAGALSALTSLVNPQSPDLNDVPDSHTEVVALNNVMIMDISGSVNRVVETPDVNQDVILEDLVFIDNKGQPFQMK